MADIESILKLLADPDEQVFMAIKDVVSCNISKIRSLVETSEYFYNDTVCRRISDIIVNESIPEFKKQYDSLLGTVSPEPSLLNGIVMIEKFLNPDFDSEGFFVFIKKMATTVELKCYEISPIDQPSIIIQCLEDENIYADNTPDSKNNNIYLNLDCRNRKQVLQKFLYILVYLTICQESKIKIQPILVHDKTQQYHGVGYVDAKLAKSAKIPSKNGVVFLLNNIFLPKYDLLVNEAIPLRYIDYLKDWYTYRLAVEKKLFPDSFNSINYSKIIEIFQ